MSVAARGVAASTFEVSNTVGVGMVGTSPFSPSSDPGIWNWEQVVRGFRFPNTKRIFKQPAGARSRVVVGREWTRNRSHTIASEKICVTEGKVSLISLAGSKRTEDDSPSGNG